MSIFVSGSQREKKRVVYVKPVGDHKSVSSQCSGSFAL